MSYMLGGAIFFVTWWLVLLCVLPFGIKSQFESNDITAGTEPGAPTAPRLLLKLLITTVLSIVAFAGIYYAIQVIVI